MAIVSDKPQTTRRAIRGVATGPDWQLVLVDLPGVQRPRDALTERMQQRVERELADADGCLLVVNAEQGVGPGDRFIAGLLRVGAGPGDDRRQQGRPRRPRHGPRPRCRRRPTSSSATRSSRSRRAPAPGVAALVEHLVGAAACRDRSTSRPRSAPISQPTVLLAELVREQVLARTREEVPHAVEVEVQEIRHPRDGPGADRGAWC